MDDQRKLIINEILHSVKMDRIDTLFNKLKLPKHLATLVIKYDPVLEGLAYINKTFGENEEYTEMLPLGDNHLVITNTSYEQSSPHKIMVINTQTGIIENMFIEDKSKIMKILIMGQRIVILLDNGMVKILNTEKELLWDFNIEDIWIYDKDKFISQENNTLSVWIPHTGDIIYYYELGREDVVIDVLEDNSILYQRNNSLYILNISKGKTRELSGELASRYDTFIPLLKDIFAITTPGIINIYNLEGKIFSVEIRNWSFIRKYTEDKLFIVKRNNIIQMLDVNTRIITQVFESSDLIYGLQVVGDYIILITPKRTIIYISSEFFYNKIFDTVKEIDIVRTIRGLDNGTIALLGEITHNNDDDYFHEQYFHTRLIVLR